MESCPSEHMIDTPQRFEIRTTMRRIWPVLADYYETVVYDRNTGRAVSSTGSTATESRENAMRYLLFSMR